MLRNCYCYTVGMEKEETDEEQQDDFSQKEEEEKGKAVDKCNILQY